jgi:hypothetical protein
MEVHYLTRTLKDLKTKPKPVVEAVLKLVSNWRELLVLKNLG